MSADETLARHWLADVTRQFREPLGPHPSRGRQPALALDRLPDLARTVTIRAEPHTVIEAVDRALVHTAQHVGQIVHLARHHAGGRWQTLSVPRGGTKELNRRLMGR
jgi:hypothetical protein